MWVTINQQRIELTETTSIYDAIQQSGQLLQEPQLGLAKEWIHNPLCPNMGVAECNDQLVTIPALKRRRIREGMVINTNSPSVQSALAERSQMLIEKHECFFIKEWQKNVAIEAESTGFITLEEWEKFKFSMRVAEPSILHDPNKCVRCKACIETCREVQGVSALSFDQQQGILIDDELCVRCGQCIHHCPMGAISNSQAVNRFLSCGNCAFAKPLGAMREVDDTSRVWSLLHDNQHYCVVQFAPSVRTSLGEEFGLAAGDLVTGKLYAALRRLGFKKVWDTNFAADLTIMEEGSEFIERLTTGHDLPLFTSCCPAWVRYIEIFFPDLIPHLSTAKSPQQMFGAIAKTFGASSIGIKPIEMNVFSIMPCTAKKFEITRPEMNSASAYWQEHFQLESNIAFPDVDIALTTRELARLLKMADIDLANMPDEEADSFLGSYTGAAAIFGRTGGVMEAALRTAVTLLTGQPPQPLEFDELGKPDGIKDAMLDIGGKTLSVAVVNGLANAHLVCESILQGGKFSQYHFIEIMACPGGCIGGGGQAIPTNEATRKARTSGLNYDDAQVCPLRMSHENPEVKALYNSFLEKPLSHLGHQLLHTTYTSHSRASMTNKSM